MKPAGKPEIRKILEKDIQMIENNKIRTVDWHGKRIDKEDIDILCTALKKNTSVRVVQLSHNHLEDESIFLIADLLKTNHYIVNLGLWDNHIGNAGGVALLNVIKTHPSIRYLVMSKNKFDIPVGNAVAAVIRENPMIEYLDFHENKIPNSCGRRILEAVENNKTLLWIFLGANDIEDDVEQAIYRRVVINKRRLDELLKACLHGDITKVENLVQMGTPLNGQEMNSGGSMDTPLHVAAQRGHVEIIQLLLNAKASIYLENAEGALPCEVGATEEIKIKLGINNPQLSHSFEINKNLKTETLERRRKVLSSRNDWILQTLQKNPNAKEELMHHIESRINILRETSQKLKESGSTIFTSYNPELLVMKWLGPGYLYVLTDKGTDRLGRIRFKIGSSLQPLMTYLLYREGNPDLKLIKCCKNNNHEKEGGKIVQDDDDNFCFRTCHCQDALDTAKSQMLKNGFEPWGSDINGWFSSPTQTSQDSAYAGNQGHVVNTPEEIKKSAKETLVKILKKSALKPHRFSEGDAFCNIRFDDRALDPTLKNAVLH